MPARLKTAAPWSFYIFADIQEPLQVPAITEHQRQAWQQRRASVAKPTRSGVAEALLPDQASGLAAHSLYQTPPDRR